MRKGNCIEEGVRNISIHLLFLSPSLRSVSSIALLEYMALAFESDDWMKGNFFLNFHLEMHDDGKSIS